MSWVSPVHVASDEMWCVWHDMWSGVFEFIAGREKAQELLNGGMTKINGRPCSVSAVGEWAELNAVQLRVMTVREEKPVARYDWELAEAVA